ncbi:MAG: helix-turn-helix transcriptional regulator [Parasphingorhabdus sp.]
MARVSKKTDQDEVLTRLGSCIRAIRQDHKLSQEALADAAGIDRSHMGKIERGERNVSVLNIHRIAKALEISITDLMEQSGI